MSNSRTLLLGLVVGATTFVICAIPTQKAFAQDSAVLEEIIVTATKREESLQNVPLSVTAFSQDDMDIRGYSNLQGVQESTPNLNFSVQSAGQNVARVTLRGIGTETLVGGGDPGVALHIDGVYVGRNSVAAGDIFDIARVEILRGPQGTLYGRNATGGSINVITNRPTDSLEGSADITLGNYDAFRVRSVVNVPMTDNVNARLALYSDRHDGYIENLFDTGRDSNDRDNQGDRSGGEFQLVRQYAAPFDHLLPRERQ